MLNCVVMVHDGDDHNDDGYDDDDVEMDGSERN